MWIKFQFEVFPEKYFILVLPEWEFMITLPGLLSFEHLVQLNSFLCRYSCPVIFVAIHRPRQISKKCQIFKDSLPRVVLLEKIFKSSSIISKPFERDKWWLQYFLYLDLIASIMHTCYMQWITSMGMPYCVA